MKYKIGDIEYNTIHEAIDAAKPGDTIEIFESFTVIQGVNLPSGVNLVGISPDTKNPVRIPKQANESQETTT